MSAERNALRPGDTFAYGRIATEYRGPAPGASGCWMATVVGDRSRWSAGATEREAIGALVQSHAEALFSAAAAVAEERARCVRLVEDEIGGYNPGANERLVRLRDAIRDGKEIA